MASDRAVHATGAVAEEDSLRRRNVETHKGTNGSINVSQVEVDDKKSQKKSSASGGLLQVLDDYEILIAPLIFTALAFFTRLWRIGISDIVTWDEAQYEPPSRSGVRC